MSVTKLPETVLEALGQEAAEDLTAWFEERLSRAGLLPGVQISPFIARQKVNVLVLERVSNLLLANDPQLVQVTEDEYVWRVPVDLTYPERGRVGCVGELDVDARYGQVRYDEALLADFAAKARQIAQDVMSSST
jgi:hypothetical protein